MWLPSIPLHHSMFPVTFNNRSERGERWDRRGLMKTPFQLLSSSLHFRIRVWVTKIACNKIGCDSFLITRGPTGKRTKPKSVDPRWSILLLNLYLFKLTASYKVSSTYRTTNYKLQTIVLPAPDYRLPTPDYLRASLCRCASVVPFSPSSFDIPCSNVLRFPSSLSFIIRCSLFICSAVPFSLSTFQLSSPCLRGPL
jgi:hypothetical protein